MANENAAQKVLVMDRGTVGAGKRLMAGEGFVIGDEVSPETAAWMVKHGRGHYVEKKARKPRAVSVATDDVAGSDNG